MTAFDWKQTRNRARYHAMVAARSPKHGVYRTPIVSTNEYGVELYIKFYRDADDSHIKQLVGAIDMIVDAATLTHHDDDRNSKY